MADQQRRVELLLGIRTEGSREAAASLGSLATGATSLQKELGKISRTNDFESMAVDAGIAAKRTGDVAKAVADLTQKLKALGATDDEIRGVAGSFNSGQSGGGSGPGGNLLQRIGAQGRNLPSVQIPGAGIGTDAISNLIRLTGALGEVSGAAGAITTVTTALTPALGATAAGFAGIAAVAGPLIAIAGVLAIALKSIGDQAAAESKAINTLVESQRELAQRVAEGLNSSQAAQELEILNKKRKDEAELLARNKQVYEDNINSAGALSGILKLTSGAEEELGSQITKGTDLVKQYDNDIQSLTRAQEDGTLAANDAAEAEKKLAEERSKSALSAADAAGKELAAQQKALASTEEQNKARLTSIDNERAVLDRQIETLEESGVTSEEVTAKITALKDQLGLLGKESEFIGSTALEASRAADAAKKAQKDAEDATKKAGQAQEQYTKSVKSASTAYRQSVQDIGTRLRQTLSDNELKFNRDLTDIATKYRRDEYDLALKASRAERDALQDQMNDLKDIREEANKEEQEALREGDFKALFLAREKGAETLQQEQEQIDESRRQREQEITDARDDLLRAAQRQRIDRMIGYERQNIDARTNQQRELQQAALTRQRALIAARDGLNAELALLGKYWNTRLKIEQQGLQASLALQSGARGGGGRNTANNEVNSLIGMMRR